MSDRDVMDFEEILSQFPPESSTLEYKRKRASKESIARELVSFANADGGKVVYGVHEEDGEIVGFDDFDNFSKFEESFSDLATSRIRPRLNVNMREIEYDGNTLIGLSVDSSSLLHSFRDDKPNFPVRYESITDYMEGDEIAQIYRARFGDEVDWSYSNRREWLENLRENAQRVQFQAEDNDFSNSTERRSFARAIETVTDEIVKLLESTPSSVEEEAIDQTKNMLRVCRILLEKDTSATPNVDISDIMSGPSNTAKTRNKPDYLGDNPEEVEQKFTQAAEDVISEAEETISYIDNNLQLP